jgi:uncharacterized tellurite resistance protein B-like protein
MFKAIKNLWSFRPRTDPTFPLGNLSPDLQKATAVLLLEVTRADLRVIHTELKEVERALGSAFRLSLEEAAKLLKEAEQAQHDKRAVERLGRLIDTNLSLDQKRQVVELLWSIALGDARLERDEDYMVRKIARWLSLNHIDDIGAKLKAEANLQNR